MNIDDEKENEIDALLDSMGCPAFNDDEIQTIMDGALNDTDITMI